MASRRSRWLQTVRSVFVGLGLLTEGAAADAQVTVNEPCQCADSAVARWDSVRTFQQGVSARDPVGDTIGTHSAAQRFFRVKVPGLGNHWKPLDIRKRTLCGRVEHSNMYELAFVTPDEKDWNHFIIPNDAFRELLYLGKGQQPKKCQPKKDAADDECVETEVTPAGLLRRVVSERNEDLLKRDNLDLCVYGPWVLDRGHSGGKPEIHPSEMLWWRNSIANTSLEDFWLLLIQDNSRRYDAVSDFTDNPRRGWTPWAASPQRGEFRVAFSVSDGAAPLTAMVLSHLRRNSATALDTAAKRDATDQPRHELRFRGRTVLTVIEPDLARDDDVGVKFDGLCVRRDGTLQGYLRLDVHVERTSTQNSGYHVVRVVMATNDAEPMVRRQIADSIAIEPQAPELQVSVVPGSIRQALVDGRLQMLADVSVRALSAPGEDLRPVGKGAAVLSGAMQEERSLTKWRAMGGNNAIAGTLRAVPLGAGDTIRYIGRTETINAVVPGIALAAIALDPDTLLRSRPAPTAWATFIAAAGVQAPVPPASPQLVQRVGSWTIELVAAYVPERDSAPALDESSPLVERLNDALATGNQDVLRRVFGSVNPITTDLALTGTNLTTGQPVAVHRGASGAPAGAIVIRDTTAEMGPAGNRFIAEFPNDDAVYELVAIGRMTDPFGRSGTVEHRVVNHVLDVPRDSVDVLLRVTASLLGARGDDLISQSSLNSGVIHSPGLSATKLSRARSARLLAVDITDGSRVTRRELRELIEAVRLWVDE